MNNQTSEQTQPQQQQQTPQTAGFNIPKLDIMQCYTEPAPILDFVLKGLLAGTCGALISQGGVGKSMLALILHCLVSTGKTVGNLGVFGTGTVGKCTYVGLEDPHQIIQMRLHAITHMMINAGQGTENDIAQWNQNGTILPAYGQGIKVGSKPHEDWIKRISEGQRLVIVDTLRRSHDGNENDNGEMSEILGFFEEISQQTGTAILLLHHTPKNPNDTGNITARGASAITDNLRFVSSLRPANQKELEAFGVTQDAWRHVVYEVNKCNYSEPLEPLWLVKGINKGILELLGERQAVMAGAAQSPPVAKRKTSRVEDKEYADDDF